MRLFLLLCSVLLGCNREAGQPAPQPLSPREISRLMQDDDVKDREGWATDVVFALEASERAPTAAHVCEVLAVIEQESGYQEDPAVPGLGRIVKQQLDDLFDKLGPAGDPVRAALLDHAVPPHTRTFEERLARVRTEAEADRLYREIVRFHQERYPAISRALEVVAPQLVENNNPITTAGSMQVSVRQAIEMGREDGLSAEEVRDQLYTRRGGLLYGTRRLFSTADYEEPVHRFADFNAGAYASRNAAFQEQLSALTGIDLALDGDLLVYNDKGRRKRKDSETLRALLVFRSSFAPDLTEVRVRRDARREKSAALEETRTWTALRSAYEERAGKDPAYARIPDVALKSPKMSKERSTRWFAESVLRRYRSCLSRAGG